MANEYKSVESVEAATGVKRSGSSDGVDVSGGMWHVWQNVLYACLATVMILSANSVYGLSSSEYQNLAGFALLLGALVVCSAALRGHITLPMVQWCSVWALVVIGVFGLLWSFSGGAGPKEFLLSLLVLPLAVCAMWGSGDYRLFTWVFVGAVLVLAIASLALWLAGPIGGLLHPNCSVSNGWGDVPGETNEMEGYYWLLFHVDSQSFGVGGLLIPRNIGIFPEAPMWSFVLCVAFATELFLRERPRTWALAILSMTVLTTFSTTGYVFFLAALCCYFLFVRRALSGLSRGRRLALSVAVVAVVCLGIALVVSRSSSGSGAIRIDDFHAGFLAWANDVLMGNGNSTSGVLREFESAFRIGNQGFSNSLFMVLAGGGLILFMPYLISTVLSLVAGKEALACFSGLSCVLCAVTFVWHLPITALLVSLGLAVPVMVGAPLADCLMWLRRYAPVVAACVFAAGVGGAVHSGLAPAQYIAVAKVDAGGQVERVGTVAKELQENGAYEGDVRVIVDLHSETVICYVYSDSKDGAVEDARSAVLQIAERAGFSGPPATVPKNLKREIAHADPAVLLHALGWMVVVLEAFFCLACYRVLRRSRPLSKEEQIRAQSVLGS